MTCLITPEVETLLISTGRLVSALEHTPSDKESRAHAVASVLADTFALIAAAAETHPEEPALFDALAFLAPRLAAAQARVEGLDATFH